MSELKKFTAFGLSDSLLNAVSSLGYEVASPVQIQAIPLFLEGGDLVVQAQTGSGKTAAFALPILQKLDLLQQDPQALILAPTRELAIQVAEAFQSYAKYLHNFHVVPIYGGQDYAKQIRAIKRGAHVIVATPGRLMDHMRSGKISLSKVHTIILDEADEMLNMGFLEDVEWILEHLPKEHQCGMFSATMPDAIRKIAKKYLTSPKHVSIGAKNMASSDILQNAMLVSTKHKLEALTRYLEIEKFDGVIIFARTKNMTVELADKLAARGHSVVALNGDMNQNARTQAVNQLKEKRLDIVVATDVAARGLDVEHLSHVINYDAPHDVETYVHRIGRTGRAGRSGKALILITPRERRYLRDVERITKQNIRLIEPPTIAELREMRVEDFTARLLKTMRKDNLEYYRELVEKIAYQNECAELDIAAALLKMAQKDKPLQVSGNNKPLLDESELRDDGGARKKRRPGKFKGSSGRRKFTDKGSRNKRSKR
ncbi:MAG: DEAD/DEAH box helicase [Gammaproteobacteria bacterium]|nr:DEAD/DEAH box helicase [Gammaproteobacteria bacterium]